MLAFISRSKYVYITTVQLALAFVTFTGIMGIFSSKNHEEEARRRQEEVERKLEYAGQERVRRMLHLIRLQEQEDRRREILIEYQRKEKLRREVEIKEAHQLHLFKSSLIQHTITMNLTLLNDLRRCFSLSYLDEFPQTSYKEEKLSEVSEEYSKVRGIFRRSNKPFFQVTHIMKIDNPFLVLHYKLAKGKCKENYGLNCNEEIMFHGTKRDYLNSICNSNFDKSKVRTHKFGNGVSFAHNSFYATHYHHDNIRVKQKVMILAQVFREDRNVTEVGGPYTIVPEEPFYTTTNDEGSVCVKYDDASFYPRYIVYYEGIHPPRQRR